MPKHIVVHDMRAVGMHHYGSTKLIVGGRYTTKWEPDCLYDLGNAMAILDHKKCVKLYIFSMHVLFSYLINLMK